jgi:ribosome-associated heat shock protein Hsp15
LNLDDSDQDRVRVDKWLWAARFFKTRGLAQAAVTAGKVRVNDERVKPAKEIRTGDVLAVRVGEYEWNVTVRAVCARRGPAEFARTLYEESAESHARRIAQAGERRAHGSVWGDRKGRPTKRERRQIERWRGGDG